MNWIKTLKYEYKNGDSVRIGKTEIEVSRVIEARLREDGKAFFLSYPSYPNNDTVQKQKNFIRENKWASYLYSESDEAIMTESEFEESFNHHMKLDNGNIIKG